MFASFEGGNHLIYQVNELAAMDAETLLLSGEIALDEGTLLDVTIQLVTTVVAMSRGFQTCNRDYKVGICCRGTLAQLPAEGRGSAP